MSKLNEALNAALEIAVLKGDTKGHLADLAFALAKTVALHSASSVVVRDDAKGQARDMQELYANFCIAAMELTADSVENVYGDKYDVTPLRPITDNRTEHNIEVFTEICEELRRG